MALFNFPFGRPTASNDVEMSGSEVCCLNLACDLSNSIQRHSAKPASLATTPVLHVYPPQPISQDKNPLSLHNSSYSPQTPTHSFLSHRNTTPNTPTPSSCASLDFPTTCPQTLIQTSSVLSGPSLASTSTQSVDNQLAVALRPRIPARRRIRDDEDPFAPLQGEWPGYKVQVSILVISY